MKKSGLRTEIVRFENYTFKILVDPDMPNYSKDPYFVKKFEEAKLFLEKHPPPDVFTESQKSKRR